MTMNRQCAKLNNILDFVHHAVSLWRCLEKFMETRSNKVQRESVKNTVTAEMS